MGLNRKMKSKYHSKKKPVVNEIDTNISIGDEKTETTRSMNNGDFIHVTVGKEKESIVGEEKDVYIRMGESASSSELCDICYNHPCVCINIKDNHVTSSVVPSCDACQVCGDKCGYSDCIECRHKTHGKIGEYTVCQVLRHKSMEDCWLIANGYVYNVTSMIKSHPGGIRSILNGTSRDCSRDYDFHGVGGKGEWEKCKIGRLIQCPGRLRNGMKDKVIKDSCIIS